MFLLAKIAVLHPASHIDMPISRRRYRREQTNEAIFHQYPLRSTRPDHTTPCLVLPIRFRPSSSVPRSPAASTAHHSQKLQKILSRDTDASRRVRPPDLLCNVGPFTSNRKDSPPTMERHPCGLEERIGRPELQLGTSPSAVLPLQMTTIADYILVVAKGSLRVDRSCWHKRH